MSANNLAVAYKPTHVRNGVSWNNCKRFQPGAVAGNPSRVNCELSHVRIGPLRDEAEERRRSISHLRDSWQYDRVRTEGGAFSCRAASSRDTSSASSTIRTIRSDAHLANRSTARRTRRERFPCITLDSSDLPGALRGLRDDRELVDYVPDRQRDRRASR
jgi:hypothetical protein